MERDALIYDLIFSTEEEFTIMVNEYIEDIYKYDYFIDDIKLILKKSKVTIEKEKIKTATDIVIWKIKVKRK